MKIYELSARYDARKSFYGKAHIIDYENGTLELQSYDTIVSRCVVVLMERQRSWASGVRQRHGTRRNLESSLNIKEGVKND